MEGQRRGDPPQSLGTFISVATDARLMIALDGTSKLASFPGQSLWLVGLQGDAPWNVFMEVGNGLKAGF